MAKIIIHEGKKYLKIGDKAIPIDHFDEAGKPVITQTYSTEKKYPDGRVDCTIHVPCFQIVTKSHKPS